MVLSTSRPEELVDHLRDKGLEAAVIGSVGGSRLRNGTALDVSVEDLGHAMRGRIPDALGETVGVTS